MKKLILTEIEIDFASPVPVYEQIKKKIKHSIAKKLLSVNDPMPSIREMASFLKINPNTVARAYRELQRENIINGRAGKGFWVEKGETAGSEKIGILREEFLKFLEKGIEMGIPSASIKELINEFFKEVK